MRTPLLAIALLASGCGALPEREPPPPAAPPAQAKGGYYKDDGPGDRPPADLAALPDAVPRVEPLHRYANRPYQVFGKDYVPLTRLAAYRQQGTASWYGRRFHGQKTASGEPYDMYAMSAAHPVLPIPSYARVTNIANGRSVVVRVNDRGPFHAGRIIDLSYAAAYRLGYTQTGSAAVEVESLVPGESAIAAAPQEKGVFLQLGAFSVREAAEDFRARVTRELAWLSQAIHVIASGGLFRLQLGPYRTADEARPVAERIQSELSFKPLFVFR